MKYLLSHLPEAVWGDIAGKVNINMAKESNNMGRGRSNKKQVATLKEALHYYGINVFFRKFVGSTSNRSNITCVQVT